MKYIQLLMKRGGDPERQRVHQQLYFRSRLERLPVENSIGLNQFNMHSCKSVFSIVSMLSPRTFLSAILRNIYAHQHTHKMQYEPFSSRITMGMLQILSSRKVLLFLVGYFLAGLTWLGIGRQVCLQLVLAR